MSAIIPCTRRLLPGLRSGISHFCRMATNTTANISIIAGITFIPFSIAVTAAVDLANAIRIKSSLQAAADAGVLAATTALASGYNDTDKERIALDTFFANLSPELLAAFPADPEVTIDFTTQTVHMDVEVDTDQLLTNLITDSVTIGVASTATADQGSPVCLMALNPTAWKGLNIQGTADVLAVACAVHVNSGDAEAMRQNGSSAAIAESFCVFGEYTGTNYTPTPREGCMREQDPLAYQFGLDLAAHNSDALPCRGDMPDVGNGKSATRGPGVYCGGLDVKGSLTLQPGIHVFREGELKVSAGGWLTGNGVTILLTGNNTWFETQAGANVSLSAPASEKFAGIVVAQHPNSIPPANKKNVIIGGGYLNFDGIMYYPKQHLKVTGNGDINADANQFAIIADTIDIEGNGTLTIHIASDAPGSGLPALPQANETIRLIH